MAITMYSLGELIRGYLRNTIGNWTRYAIILVSGLFFALAIVLPPVFLPEYLPLPSSLLWFLYLLWLILLLKALRKVMSWAKEADQSINRWESGEHQGD